MKPARSQREERILRRIWIKRTELEWLCKVLEEVSKGRSRLLFPRSLIGRNRRVKLWKRVNNYGGYWKMEVDAEGQQRNMYLPEEGRGRGWLLLVTAFRKMGLSALGRIPTKRTYAEVAKVAPSLFNKWAQALAQLGEKRGLIVEGRDGENFKGSPKTGAPRQIAIESYKPNPMVNELSSVRFKICKDGVIREGETVECSRIPDATPYVVNNLGLGEEKIEAERRDENPEVMADETMQEAALVGEEGWVENQRSKEYEAPRPTYEKAFLPANGDFQQSLGEASSEEAASVQRRSYVDIEQSLGSEGGLEGIATECNSTEDEQKGADDEGS
ncbi:hypothetical protein F0562_006143 [Nyssa sinensis]|uniref:Uncharacterized protein n=1 Tax=Nyssa sinensis TaxID=561372 RepID=A0A5J5AKB4_9ASTE|nr:hypothetical protein F0562_006143 [Nyssa sinensis]